MENGEWRMKNEIRKLNTNSKLRVSKDYFIFLSLLSWQFGK
jgi:hypothetical protein